MKKIIMIMIVLFSLTTTEKAVSQVGVSVDFNTFYTTLNPYGRWVDYPQYGKIWICNEASFRPYYNSGHWEYTNDGWTWISDYPWGWAPFHYGRWANIDGYGWAWVPGYDWAPAWVSWCDGDDYYGWAPLGPGLGISISISSIPADRWCFVPHQYINSPSIRNYYVDNSRNAAIYQHATFINNIHSGHKVNYVAGPRRADVERVTHTTIQTRTISYAQKPGRTVVNNNTINIYRPHAMRTTPKPANRSGNITPGNSARTNNPPSVNNTPNAQPTQPRANRNPVNHQHTTPLPRPKRTNTQQQVQPQAQPHQQRMQQQRVQQQRVQQPRPQQQQHINNPPVQNNQPKPGNIPVERNPGGGQAREPQRRN